jgi:O-antigen/teichoic acid export membrane protein
MLEIQSNLLERLRRGVGAQGLAQLLQIFIRFAEVPLFLSFWGVRLYGEWLMLSSIAAYLSMSDGGFASAAGREIAMRGGARDQEGVLTIFQSTWALLLLISVCLFLAAIPIVNVLPLTIWMHLEEIDPASANSIVILLVAHVVLGMQGGLIYGGFWYSGRYPLGMMLATLTQLLEFVGLAVAVASGGGPVEAAIGSLGGRLIGIVLMWQGLHRSTPWLCFGFQNASAREIKRLASPAIASLAFPLGNALNLQGLWLVVGIVLGPIAVTAFSVMRTMTRLAAQPTSLINRVIEPEMGTAFGNGDTLLVSRLFSRSCQITAWVSLGLCLVLVSTAHWLLPLWTAGKVEMDWPLFIFLLIAGAINAIWYTALMVPYATNRHGRIAVLYSTVYGGGAFLFAYIAGKAFGFTGIGAAVLLVELIMGVYVFLSALRLSGLNWLEWLRILSRPPWFLFRQGLIKS